MEITIALSKPAEGVDQQAYVVYDMKKAEVLEMKKAFKSRR
ncbi:MAG TPA: hypothetical protein PLN52_02540 [Opitutaceae bacterium]|nr:hypothetical protein [Opitutaceae bacterium]